LDLTTPHDRSDPAHSQVPALTERPYRFERKGRARRALYNPIRAIVIVGWCRSTLDGSLIKSRLDLAKAVDASSRIRWDIFARATRRWNAKT
jgi:hypothetical protein